jgi:ATP-dependent DNA helicase DinG
VSFAAETPMVLLNAPLTGQRLGYDALSGLDLLELWAFVHPARFLVPTLKGLAQALGLEPPAHEQDTPAMLIAAAAALATQITQPGWAEREGAWMSAQSLQRLRWPWAPIIGPLLERPKDTERWLFTRLPEWDEQPPRPAPRPYTPPPDAIETQLETLTGSGAEPRPGQRAYAQAAAAAFAPRPARDRPNIVLAEAGTGIGKTLGYLAPASLWAGEAGGAVWISTYTKALQRQLDAETLAHPRRIDKRARQGGGAQGAGELSLPAQSGRRAARRRSPGGRRSSPIWSRAGRPTRQTATWSAAICPAGWARCSAATARPRSPTGAANASMPAARITANASSNAACAARKADHRHRQPCAGDGQRRAWERRRRRARTRMILDEAHHMFDAADSTFAAALTGRRRSSCAAG